MLPSNNWNVKHSVEEKQNYLKLLLLLTTTLLCWQLCYKPCHIHVKLRHTQTEPVTRVSVDIIRKCHELGHGKKNLYTLILSFYFCIGLRNKNSNN